MNTLSIPGTRATIDTDQRPPSIGDKVVLEHFGMGKVAWQPDSLSLFRTMDQTWYGFAIGGFHLKRKLQTYLPYNATVLDFLLKNQHLIPVELSTNHNGEKQHICFWGTVYGFSSKDPARYIRSMYLGTHGWESQFEYVKAKFGRLEPAAVAPANILGINLPFVARRLPM